MYVETVSYFVAAHLCSCPGYFYAGQMAKMLLVDRTRHDSFKNVVMVYFLVNLDSFFPESHENFVAGEVSGPGLE